MKSLAAAFSLVVIAFSTAIQAQSLSGSDVPRIESLVPLSDYLSQPEERIVAGYLPTRCAGLFLGHKYYGGQNYDAATSAGVEQAIASLRSLAIMVRLGQMAKSKGIALADLPSRSVGEVAEATWSDINAFAFFYDDRMKANFLQVGEAFGKDPLISGDLSLCNQAAALAVQSG